MRARVSISESSAKSSITSPRLPSAVKERHSAVLRRFGRYPHRNEFYSRATTPEEARWLASDECPGWAKSQRPRPKG